MYSSINSRVVLGAVVALLLAAVPVTAGGRGEPDSTVAPEPLSLVERLAAGEFGGRMTGSPGNEAAAEHLAATLAAAGLVPLHDAESMLEYYEQPVLRSDGPPALAFRPVGGEACPDRPIPGVDFDVLIRPGLPIAGDIQVPLAVADRSTFSAAWVGEHAEAALLIPAAVFEVATRDGDLMRALFSPDGPPAVILWLPEQVERMQRGVYLPDGTYGGEGPILLQVTDAVARAMVDLAPAEVAVSSTYRVESARVANVVARLPGDAVGGPPVILSAHFDGQGRVGPTLYPGAVDNATGVAAVVTASARLASAGPAAHRPIWVVLFNGEEQGMHGSQAFVRRHRTELDGATVINVDMVAHDANQPVEVAAGADSDGLSMQVASALREAGLPVATSSAAGSDHASFAGAAQAVTLVQAPYAAMHSPADTVEKVDATLLDRLVAALAAAAVP